MLWVHVCVNDRNVCTSGLKKKKERDPEEQWEKRGKWRRAEGKPESVCIVGVELAVKKKTKDGLWQLWVGLSIAVGVFGDNGGRIAAAEGDGGLSLRAAGGGDGCYPIERVSHSSATVGSS